MATRRTGRAGRGARIRRESALSSSPCGELGLYLDGDALGRRYKKALARAGLRPLRFHDLRHTFGTRMIAKADIRRVQEWMGHADIATTMRYLHYVERPDEAALVADAFAIEPAATPVA